MWKKDVNGRVSYGLGVNNGSAQCSEMSNIGWVSTNKCFVLGDGGYFLTEFRHFALGRRDEKKRACLRSVCVVSIRRLSSISIKLFHGV